MQIEVGDRLPSATFRTLDLTEDGSCPKEISSSEIFDNKTVVLVGVPGAFSSTCTEKHIPPFISRITEFRAKGIDTIACLSTNDAFVMGHWAKHLNNEGKLLFLADGNGTFVKELGLMADMSTFGMGMRNKRFAMVVKNGVIKHLAVDAGPVLESSAESVLASIRS